MSKVLCIVYVHTVYYMAPLLESTLEESTVGMLPQWIEVLSYLVRGVGEWVYVVVVMFCDGSFQCVYHTHTQVHTCAIHIQT